MSVYAIVGGGVAGVTAARSLAQSASHPGDQIHIFSSEPYPYYPRPLLWKYIAGEKDRESLFAKPLSWYEANGIAFHAGTRVTALDTEARALTLESGAVVPYDRLLLTTGAHPFVPPVEGAGKKGVFTLRSLDDAVAIKEQARSVPHAVVIGGGLLGLETALAIRSAGPDVHVLEIAEHLLPRQLDREGATILRGLLESSGLELSTGVMAEAILGDEHAEGVRVRDGRVVEGGLVLFSAGIRCRAHLAREAGLEVNRGAVVDATMHTSAPDVYAAGDVAEFEGEIYGIIPAAVDQANIAAANMVEPGSAIYGGTLPSTTLKVAGAQVTSLGEYSPVETGDVGGRSYQVVRNADAERGIYRKFVLRDGRVVGAITINDPRRGALARQLIDRETVVSEHSDLLVEDAFDAGSLM
ncbi:MAG: FAD-dependent oxidoreductase [Anaerolineae bacterium]